jgi:hypothetical protein
VYTGLYCWRWDTDKIWGLTNLKLLVNLCLFGQSCPVLCNADKSFSFLMIFSLHSKCFDIMQGFDKCKF